MDLVGLKMEIKLINKGKEKIKSFGKLWMFKDNNNLIQEWKKLINSDDYEFLS